MTWHETDDVEQWLAAVADLLLPEPGRHSIVLTQAENVRHQPDDTRWAWWSDGSKITGAAMHCPGFPAVLSCAPDEAIRPWVQLWRPDRIAGPTALAVHAAQVASQGRTVELKDAERLFRLTTLTAPTVSGRARLATAEDAPTLIPWFDAFMEEAQILVRPDSRMTVPQRIERAGLMIWDDGGPRAMAGHNRLAFGGIRVGPVFTPPEHRGRGYGGAVTAAVSQRALDLGAIEVVLYTDLANPTSNALYPRLGYRPVEDRAVLQISS